MASKGQIAIDHTEYGLGSMPSSINYTVQSLMVILWPALALAAVRQEFLAMRIFRGEQQCSGFKHGLSIHNSGNEEVADCFVGSHYRYFPQNVKFTLRFVISPAFCRNSVLALQLCTYLSTEK